MCRKSLMTKETGGVAGGQWGLCRGKLSGMRVYSICLSGCGIHGEMKN